MSGEIAKRMKDSKGQDKCEEEKLQAKQMGEEIKQLKEEEVKLKHTLDEKVHKIGNIVHDSVTASKNEDLNDVVQQWGDVEERKIDGTLGALHHH